MERAHGLKDSAAARGQLFFQEREQSNRCAHMTRTWGSSASGSSRPFLLECEEILLHLSVFDLSHLVYKSLHIF